MRRLTGAALATLLCGVVAACDYNGASSLPLPGGEGGGGYTVTMVFDDVTNLVPQETCRAGDVVVGAVESIELRDDLRATVVCRIDPDVHLAGNSVATLRETSLLGERFVALDPPAGKKARGELEPGARIDQASSHVVPDVEMVFGALSQVLNGGGLAHLETIGRELSVALGRADLPSTTRRLATLVGTLDDHRDDIVDALESVNRLAGQLADQRDVIASALEAVPEGLAVLERQRPMLVRTLRHLGDLSEVAVPLIRRTKAATVADLEHLGPILEQLAASKHRLASALEGVITFPFPSYTKYVTQGDYAGMFTTITFDLDSFNALLAKRPDLTGLGRGGSDDGSLPPVPGVPGVPEVPGVPQAPDGLPGLPTDVGGLLTTGQPRTLAELLTGGAP